jgi:hypothetical protein
MDKQPSTTQIFRTGDVIARQRLTNDPPSEVLLQVFTDLDVDLTATEEQLADMIDPDTVDELFDDDADHVGLSAVLWGHPVFITTDAIHVFEPPAHG